jgi:hypothetical protein
MNYTLHHAWDITEDGLDMTLAELKAEAMEPGGALDGALFEHHVSLDGEPRWHVDSEATGGPFLVVDVPVELWHTKRDPAPADHPMRMVAA